MIEDRIERELMADKYFDVAKHYILYRSEKEKLQIQPVYSAHDENTPVRQFEISTQDNSKMIITEIMLRSKLSYACRGLEPLVSINDLLETAISQYYIGMKEQEVDLANIFSAKSKIEKEPAYSQVAARLLLDVLYRETMGLPASDSTLPKAHKEYFKKYVREAISYDRLSPKLLDFDLDELGSAMDLSRDDLFSYLGLQTLYDRYFIHHEQRKLETPQIFWMRVAMGLAINEGEQKNKRAIEFYEVLSQFYFTSSTPTLFNSGTLHSQLSSCYLSTVMDDLHNIFKVVADDAQLSKWAGGIGNDWTNVRATGARIKGTNGTSQGVIPFLKVANDTAVAVNQCFDPDTRIFTSKGILPIADVHIGDLVLGISGKYREVTEKFVYDQKDPMIAIDIKHSLEPIQVTTAHPFYAMQAIPLGQTNERTMKQLSQEKVKPSWVDAKDLQIGDYIAQVIPQEVVVVPEFTEEDARLYGILLGDGHLSKEGTQWGVSGNPKVDTHLEFVRQYLTERNIHFWETQRGDNYVQIHWASERGVVQDATTGRFVSSGEPTLPFDYNDLYDSEKKKRISPRFSHLPKSQTLSLLQGLIETDGNVSRGKEITFSNTSLSLVEGVRYQCLRLGVPTAGNKRARQNDHIATRSDGSTTQFTGETISFDLRIPAFEELAEKVGAKPVAKKNWLETPGFIWSRVVSIANIPTKPFVCDLVVEGDESYMTSAGLAHNGGKRKGAMCAYLETWHLDIEDFLELRKNTGDERRRTHDMNTANWIPDLFMKRVRENGSWTLFSPNDTPDLHDLYGAKFEERYCEYEKMTESGQIKLFKKVEALQLWRKMLSMLFETGHPWITFKDPSNIRSPQDHVGVVHSSNLCTEILLNTSSTETAVCNLGSINLAKHVTEKGLDEQRLSSTVRTAIRMLDNVIDINFYPIIEARDSNLRHRPIGLGLMGFQDALYVQNISYASHRAVEFADASMEMISYYAILASTELAKEKGTYSTYKGSKWDRGFLPIDTIELLEKERGIKVDVERAGRMNWTPVREAVKKYGMRNSNTMAIAPTATIANITGTIPSNEPIYKHLFVKSNLSGEFTVVNPYLVDKLKSLNLWDEEMIDDLKYFDGSISEIERIPQEVKNQFLTAFEIEPEWLIECAARRQKWIDMGQSLNLYLSEPSGKKLHQMYMLSWEKGLKTNYYLRSLGATQIEKSSVDVNKRGLQPRWMKNKSASSNIVVERPETPKACNLGEGCESCQ
jgi:ribonucleoside-diphosphate reductase alpha chain